MIPRARAQHRQPSGHFHHHHPLFIRSYTALQLSNNGGGQQPGGGGGGGGGDNSSKRGSTRRQTDDKEAAAGSAYHNQSADFYSTQTRLLKKQLSVKNDDEEPEEGKEDETDERDNTLDLSGDNCASVWHTQAASALRKGGARLFGKRTQNNRGNSDNDQLNNNNNNNDNRLSWTKRNFSAKMGMSGAAVADNNTNNKQQRRQQNISNNNNNAEDELTLLTAEHLAHPSGSPSPNAGPNSFDYSGGGGASPNGEFPPPQFWRQPPPPPPVPPPTYASGLGGGSGGGGDDGLAKTLRINVGGRSARINIESECDAFFDATKEYYFEKSPLIFEYLIDYYITGKLHRPVEICPIRLRDELEFWRISPTAFAECCRFDELLGIGRAMSAKPTGLNHFANEPVYLETSCAPALFNRVSFGRQRLVLWTFLENPRSSAAAKVLSILSATFVLLSLAGLILSSMPEFQIPNGSAPIWYIQLLEICCMIFFTIEYVARLLVHPQKCAFIKQPLNVIDLLTIVPFFAEEMLPLLGVYDIELRNLRGAMVVIRIMRLARVARIFKLARYSIGLRAFGETMRKSAAELSMLGMFLLTGIMLFSTAIYFFERDEPDSKFYSIPSAWWWCVATMTTVGYGDLVPVTTGGKVVAAMASVCGIIVLAFPISMIIDKFAESTSDWRGDQFYAKRLEQQQNYGNVPDEVSTTTQHPPAPPLSTASPKAAARINAEFQRHKSKRVSRRYLF